MLSARKSLAPPENRSGTNATFGSYTLVEVGGTSYCLVI